MNFLEAENLYRKNKGFKQYVDKYCVVCNITAMQDLEHRIVREVALLYQEGREQDTGESTYTPMGECV